MNYSIMRFFLALILSIKTTFLFAQFHDDFNRNSLDDGELIWQRGSTSGIIGDFIITNNELQAQFDKGSGTRKCWISTSIADTSQSYIFEWEFKVKLDFGSLSSSLSNRNKLRVYLSATTADLNASPDGLFIEVKPVANEDSLKIQLYRTENNNESLLVSAQIVKAASFEYVDIKVKKDQENNFEIWINGNSQGKVTQDNIEVVGFFGVQIFFSSGAREDKFFFDDFLFRKYPYLDFSKIVDQQTLELSFSAVLDSITATQLDNYLLNDSISPSFIQVNGNQVLLKFDNAFTPDVANNLEIIGISDDNGNTFPTGFSVKSQFTFLNPDTTPPKIVSVKGIQDSIIIVQFNEELNEESIEINDFWLSNFKESPLFLERDTSNSYLLHFESTFSVDSVYELLVIDISDLKSNVLIDTLSEEFVFQDRWPPTVKTLSFINSNSVKVYFDEEMDSASMLNTSHYFLSSKLYPQSIIQESREVARLFFADEFTENEILTLEIQNVRDRYQNQMLTTWEGNFTYDTEKPSIPTNNAVYAISDSTVKVIFTEAVDTLTAKIVNNYRLSTDNESWNPRQIEVDSTNYNIVYLHLANGLESEKEYSLRVSDVSDLAGNTMNTRTRKFYYDVRAPFAEKVNLFPNNKVLVTFNEPPDLDITKDTTDFSIDGIHPLVIKHFYENDRKFWLVFDSLIISDSLLFTIDNITDFQGNTIYQPDTIYLNNHIPQVSNLQLLSSNSLLLEFSMEIDSSWYLDTNKVSVNNTYEPDSIHLNGNEAILFFEYEWNQDSIYHLTIDSLYTANEEYNLNLKESFIYTKNITNAYLKDDYQIILECQQPLLKDSLSSNGFSLNRDSTPVSVFSSEDGNQLTLLFQDKFSTDSTYDLKVGPLRMSNGDISPAQSFALVVDQTPPFLEEKFFSSFQEVTLQFNESLLENTAKAFNHYLLNYKGNMIMPASIEMKNNKTVILEFDNAFLPSETYSLQIENIKDLSGNILTPYNTELTFPKIPNKGGLIINEIMADPTPQMGLPSAEYIEVFNTTGESLNLLHVTLEDESKRIQLSATEILANGFVILCDKDFESEFSNLGKTIPLSSFPSITNSGETLKLWNSSGQLLDAVNYYDNWHDASKKEGGWSIERIQVSYSCNEKDNWRSSINSLGGTPGMVNSVLNQIPDIVLPYSIGHQLLNEKTIEITFSEEMDTTDYSLLNNFQLNISTYPQSMEWIGTDTLQLVLTAPIEKGRISELIYSGLQDCFGNAMLPDTITFVNGKSPELHDILITEIMADPKPSVGLPEVEYLEIYNSTDQLIDLSGCTLSDATSTTELIGFILPKSYRVLCSSSNAYHFDEKALGISGFPTLNNSGESLVIKNKQGTLVNFVHYTDNWYRDESKSNGGYSLAMLDVNFPCGGEENWIASASLMGGTPGEENVAKDTITDNFPPTLQQVYALDSVSLVLVFNENVDSISLRNATYSIKPNIDFVNMYIDAGYLFDRVQLQLSEPLQAGVEFTVGVKNIQDCSGNTQAQFSYQSFVLPQVAAKDDILLSEILFNPPPLGVDFIEIYNASDKYIDLQNWKIANGKGDEVLISDEVHILTPRRFLVITSDISAFKTMYPSVPDSLLKVVKLPSFNDDSGEVTILDTTSDIMQRFSYEEDMHHRLLEDVEGVSLERIDYTVSEEEPSNWHSAAANIGFATPGSVNSQNSEITSIEEGCFVVRPALITPDFDGQDDFAKIQYSCQQNGTMASVTVYDVQGKVIRKLIQNQSLANEGFFIWDGTKDNGEKANIGYYIILVETFDLDGNLSVEKMKIAIGARF